MAPGTEMRRRIWRQGRQAEWLAGFWLRAKGYRILARNFRHAGAEIDILARRGGVLVALEVKRRSDLETAAEAIQARQRHRIQRAASLFLSRQKDAASLTLRFDAFLLARGRWPHHIEDAWRPD